MKTWGKYVTVTQDFNPQILVNVSTICGEDDEGFLFVSKIEACNQYIFGGNFTVLCIEISRYEQEKLIDPQIEDAKFTSFNTMTECQQDFIDFCESQKWLKL